MEQKAQSPKKKIFICHRYPSLRMVFKKDCTVTVDGITDRRPAEYVCFIRTNYGGQFETNDQAKIDWMRQQPQFLEGLIEEVDAEDLAKAAKDRPQHDPHPVAVGMQGTVARQPQPSAAAPEPTATAAPSAAKVPVAVAEEHVEENPF